MIKISNKTKGMKYTVDLSGPRKEAGDRGPSWIFLQDMYILHFLTYTNRRLLYSLYFFFFNLVQYLDVLSRLLCMAILTLFVCCIIGMNDNEL